VPPPPREGRRATAGRAGCAFRAEAGVAAGRDDASSGSGVAAAALSPLRSPAPRPADEGACRVGEMLISRASKLRPGGSGVRCGGGGGSGVRCGGGGRCGGAPVGAARDVGGGGGSGVLAASVV